MLFALAFRQSLVRGLKIEVDRMGGGKGDRDCFGEMWDYGHPQPTPPTLDDIQVVPLCLCYTRAPSEIVQWTVMSLFMLHLRTLFFFHSLVVVVVVGRDCFLRRRAKKKAFHEITVRYNFLLFFSHPQNIRELGFYVLRFLLEVISHTTKQRYHRKSFFHPWEQRLVLVGEVERGKMDWYGTWISIFQPPTHGEHLSHHSSIISQML